MMAFDVFPIAVASSGSTGAQSITLSSSGTPYGATRTFPAGTYTIACISSVNVTIIFLGSDGSIISQGTTATGGLNITLNSPAASFVAYSNTGSNTVVTITLSASNITSTVSPQGVETITATQTYTDTSSSGFAFVVAVGGGGNGTGPFAGYMHPGGGGSGGVASGIIKLNGSVALTVGAAGGTTSAGNVIANGGGTPASYSYGAGGGGSPGGGAGGAGTGSNNSAGSNGTASQSPDYAFVKTGTTGGGGGSGQVGTTSGAGSGIGTGGNGGNSSNSGSGYGAGGGTKNINANGGTSGTQGVIYLMKFQLLFFNNKIFIIKIIFVVYL